MTRSDAIDRPFLIVTLQRTGGTNLTFQLTKRSSWKLAETHEPFNKPRIYGHITKAFLKDGNKAAVAAAMPEIAARQEIVKHCVEMVPFEITEALIDAFVAADYRFLFLYREDPVGRMLSAEYARRTKVWGPSHVHKVAEDAVAFETPLDVTGLMARERDCIERLNTAWRRLRDKGAAPVALSFEEMFGPDPDRAWTGLSRVLAGLDLARGDTADRKLLDTVRGRGDQNTRDRYARFIGLDDLRIQARTLPDFAFSAG